MVVIIYPPSAHTYPLRIAPDSVCVEAMDNIRFTQKIFQFQLRNLLISLNMYNANTWNKLRREPTPLKTSF